MVGGLRPGLRAGAWWGGGGVTALWEQGSGLGGGLFTHIETHAHTVHTLAGGLHRAGSGTAGER